MVISCARPSARDSVAYKHFVPGFNNYADRKGVDYIHGGDPYMNRRMKEIEDDIAPSPQGPGSKSTQPRSSSPVRKIPKMPKEPIKSPSVPDGQHLIDRLMQFEISRFDKGNQEPKRFGHSTFILDVFFSDRNLPIKFSGELKPPVEPMTTWHVAGQVSGYELSGDLTDFEADDKITGVFLLIDHHTGETAEISYRAFKARLLVFPDQEKKVDENSKLGCEIKALSQNIFLWVNRWNMPYGKSFYRDDGLATGSTDDFFKQGCQTPIISIRGESKAASLIEDEAEPAESLPGNSLLDIKNIGNSTHGERQAFEAELTDKDSGEKTSLVLRVENVNPDDGPELAPDETPQVYGAAKTNGTSEQTAEDGPPEPNGVDEEAINDGSPTDGEQKLVPSPAPGSAPKSAARPTPKSAPTMIVTSGGYFGTDITNSSKPRSRKYILDLNRNENVPGVLAKIHSFQNEKRQSLQNFFDYYNPIRVLVKTIGEVFDASAEYGIPTVVESNYFTGASYQIQKASGSSALGPFQLTFGTATGVGHMYANKKFDPDDERRFSAPSSCGAARLTTQLIDRYRNGDSTLTILAYFQGEGGAAAVEYCLNSPEQAGNRQACVERVNGQTMIVTANGKRLMKKTKNFSSKEYAKFMQFSQRYHYPYSGMARTDTMIPIHMSDYVNKVLAVHVIAMRMAHWGFSLSKNAQTQYPHGTTFPQKQIQDSVCREVVRQVRTGVAATASL